jgi:sugar/nucleoside kinase (ribokinase family)
MILITIIIHSTLGSFSFYLLTWNIFPTVTSTTHSAILYVTWSEAGAFGLINDPTRPARTFHVPAPSIFPVDTIGAGDTFTAGIVHALGARGCDAKSAAGWACKLATAKCAQLGFEGLSERYG